MPGQSSGDSRWRPKPWSATQEDQRAELAVHNAQVFVSTPLCQICSCA